MIVTLHGINQTLPNYTNLTRWYITSSWLIPKALKKGKNVFDTLEFYNYHVRNFYTFFLKPSQTTLTRLDTASYFLLVDTKNIKGRNSEKIRSQIHLKYIPVLEFYNYHVVQTFLSQTLPNWASYYIILSWSILKGLKEETRKRYIRYA